MVTQYPTPPPPPPPPHPDQQHPEQAKFPNLRRLFIEARTDDEERAVSRTAFYNAVLFMGSVAVFSVIAQKMNAIK